MIPVKVRRRGHPLRLAARVRLSRLCAGLRDSVDPVPHIEQQPPARLENAARFAAQQEALAILLKLDFLQPVEIAQDGVVGKGDLRQQIEQVGKNVGACLEAGGATVKDIVFTVSFVKDPAEFDKYADLRLRYFGPPSPDSTIVPMPQSTNSDLLVQVEAFAKTE
jgi:enamine deaminase RidA (YjgF/YER057c/UK114 family)